jgi:hypothetical protein
VAFHPGRTVFELLKRVIEVEEGMRHKFTFPPGSRQSGRVRRKNQGLILRVLPANRQMYVGMISGIAKNAWVPIVALDRVTKPVR